MIELSGTYSETMLIRAINLPIDLMQGNGLLIITISTTLIWLMC